MKHDFTARLTDMYNLWNLSQPPKEWPQNRTMNIVFHGYAVPAGFFKTPVVNAESSYPTLQLKKLPGHVFL
jgi:hypothetical protein